MADLQNHSVSRQGAASNYRIEAKVLDSNPPFGVLADFTGPNALIFPGVLATLADADRDEFMSMVSAWLINKKAGVR